MKLILALFALPIVALGQGATNDYIFSQKPASGPLVSRAVTPTVGRLLGWPTSINTPAAITLGTGLSLSGSTLNATASSAWADLTGTPTTLTGYGITDALAATTAASTYQPLDADLTSIAALTTTNAGRTVLTASGSTGTGNIVYAASPTFVTKLTTPDILASALTGNLLISNQSGTTAMTISGSGSTTNVAFSSATASTIAHFSAGKILASLPLDTYPSLTELSYVKGVTSAIQTQLTATTNASNITSGALALARIEQAGATSGQAIAWNGTAWAPATISSGATLAANTYTGLQQFSGTTHAGIRLNNLTTAERDALTGAAGMAIWNTTDGRLQLHNGSAWTSGMVRLSGDTMTGALTITQGTANTGILTSTGYSLTGSNATPMIDLAGTWNTSGTPTGIKINITNTASNSASSLIDLQSGGTSRFRVLATGGTVLGGGQATPLTIISSTATNTWTATGDGSLLQSHSIVLPATGYVRFGFVGANDPIITGASSSITINQITTFQLGANTATNGATAIGQTIKGPNATGTTSTGGSLTIEGGTGTSSGGAVIIRTAATTTQTERARFSSAGVTIGASGTAIASVISATGTLDFPSTNAHSASALTITVTGAAVGDVVALGIPTEAIGTNGVFFGYVSAADTVTVRFCNTDSGPAVDPASGTFRATVIKH